MAAIAELVSIACARTVVAEDKELFLGELGMSYLSAAPKNVSFVSHVQILKHLSCLSKQKIALISVLKSNGRTFEMLTKQCLLVLLLFLMVYMLGFNELTSIHLRCLKTWAAFGCFSNYVEFEYLALRMELGCGFCVDQI